jgi:hypothetical protein
MREIRREKLGLPPDSLISPFSSLHLPILNAMKRLELKFPIAS